MKTVQVHVSGKIYKGLDRCDMQVRSDINEHYTHIVGESAKKYKYHLVVGCALLQDINGLYIEMGSDGEMHFIVKLHNDKQNIHSWLMTDYFHVVLIYATIFQFQHLMCCTRYIAPILPLAMFTFICKSYADFPELALIISNLMCRLLNYLTAHLL